MQQPGELAHSHVLYRSDRELLDRTVDALGAAVDDGDAVLVCLPEAEADLVGAALGPAKAKDVTFVAASTRYARPVDAMTMLHDFVGAALEHGHRRVHSYGSIAFSGAAADTPWFRYEAAVNRVFAGVPLTAVCLTDAATTSAAVVAALELLHGTHGHDAAAEDRFLRGLPPSGALPARAPDLITDGTGAEARRAVADAFGATLGEQRTHDLQLVLTELISNAQRHAGGAARTQVWVDDAVTVAVTDDADGIADPAAGLCPIGTDDGGRGLWIVHQLCERVDFVAGAPGHTVCAVLREP